MGGGQRPQRKRRAHCGLSTRRERAAAVLAGRMEGRALAGQRGRGVVWESEWQWRIERANVLRMNGPDAGEREGLSAGGLCAVPKDMARREG
jgi:hypothetical protein